MAESRRQKAESRRRMSALRPQLSAFSSLLSAFSPLPSAFSPLLSAFSPLSSALFILAVLCSATFASEQVTHPFPGVTMIARTGDSPRPVKMHVLVIDTRTPGMRFLVTPRSGKLDTTKQTTLEFLTQHKAQIAVNAHFFEPWPPPTPDTGQADLVGLAASDGDVYSPFEDRPPKSYAIRPNAPALNIDPHNVPTIVLRKPGDTTGKQVAEAVELFNAVAGNEQILTDANVTAGTGEWDNRPNPLTVIGIDGGGRLVVLVVDGRQPKVSEGLSTREAVALLARDYDVRDAINLDGGGSTTLCLADPTPRVANVPAGTLRPVGSNLAIFIATQPPSAEDSPIISPSPCEDGVMISLIALALTPLIVWAAALLWWKKRMKGL